MPGHGPPPKDPARRARRSRSSTEIPWLTVQVKPAAQPPLPKSRKWHPQTVAWWRVWKSAPQADYFSVTDWASMVETAIVHSKFWESDGDPRFASELRLREGLVGATPADRARLRMALAQAEEAEDRNERRSAVSARARRGALKALPHDEPAEVAEGS